MRATGVVRRVDDLGRVVIPKEIRRNLRIREGDPLEIYIDNDMVCFKRYCPQGMWKEDIKKMKEEIADHFWMPTSEYSELKKELDSCIQNFVNIIDAFEKKYEEE